MPAANTPRSGVRAPVASIERTDGERARRVTRDADQLVGALDRRRAELHGLPGVIGSGVGLRDGRPVVEIFVAGPGDADLEQAIREIADFEFVLVPESKPAEAQNPQRDREE